MGNSDSRSLDFWTAEEYQRFIQTIEREQDNRSFLKFLSGLDAESENCLQ